MGLFVKGLCWAHGVCPKSNKGSGDRQFIRPFMRVARRSIREAPEREPGEYQEMATGSGTSVSNQGRFLRHALEPPSLCYWQGVLRRAHRAEF